MIDPTKPVRQRNGRKARILATDLNNLNYPLAVAIEDEDGNQFLGSYPRSGLRYAGAIDPGGRDLVNIHEVIEGWLNVYGKCHEYHDGYYTSNTLYAKKKDADKYTNPGRTACIFVSNKDQQP